MAFNKRILDKIQDRCKGDKAMLDYMYRIVTFEFGESRQYTKEYEAAIREYSKKSGAR